MSVENKGINLATLKQEVYAVKVTKYLGLAPEKGLAIIGQPVPQYYFIDHSMLYSTPVFAQAS